VNVRTRIRVMILALSSLAAGCTGAEPRTPKVLVIGIDGVRPDVLAQVPTPNLDALASDGTFTDKARTGFPSVSGPGWSSLLTGVWPEKHGVTDNGFEGKRYDIYPDFLTRIESVRPELGTFAVADWLPLVEADDGMPTIGNGIDAKHLIDGYEIGWDVGDSIGAASAVERLRTSDPAALFVYLGNPDEVSHETGAIGEEYRAAVALADRHVGWLLEAVQQRPTYDREDWLILVSTDHGRLWDGDHGGDTDEERTIFYIASGPSTVKGTPQGQVHIVDVAVTALTHLGIPIDPSWDLDGRAVGLAHSGS
jgi:predicted AlkP superfamily pyrophosphatase or phosphodiesterase